MLYTVEEPKVVDVKQERPNIIVEKWERNIECTEHVYIIFIAE